MIGESHNIALLMLFSLVRFMMTIGFMIIYPYTTEIY